MRAPLIVALVVSLLAVIFALQNPQPANVTLGPFALSGSTAVVILLTFILGVVAGILASLPSIWRRQRTIKKMTHGGATHSAAPTEPTVPAQ